MTNGLHPIDSCLVHGKLLPMAQPALSVLDRGFLLADGVFETILIKNGAPCWLTQHVNRLARGANILSINHIIPPDLWLADIEKLYHANHCQKNLQYALRLTLSRGVSHERGLVITPPAHPTIVMTIHHHPLAISPAGEGLAVIVTNVQKNHRSPLSAIKWLGGYGENMVAKNLAQQQGAQDGLLMNGDGNIICSTVGNIFLLLDDVWYTPPLSDGIVDGLARANILSSNILAATERSITPAMIDNIAAGFISNSLGLQPIGRLNGRVLPLLPLSLEIYKKLQPIYCENEMTGL